MRYKYFRDFIINADTGDSIRAGDSGWQPLQLFLSGGGIPEAADFIAPHPDGLGFAQAIKAGLGGIVAANALAVAYPLFFTAVQIGNWPDVQALIIDAKTKSLLTTQQYSDIKTAATTFNIPVVL